MNFESIMPLKSLSGFAKKAIALFATLIISACGGGGGTAPVAAPKPVSPADTVAPVISLNGEATVTLQQGTTYTDPGATATDNVDGAVSATTTDTVGTAIGTYTLSYSATDSAGNSSSLQRTVNVIANPSSICLLYTSDAADE